MNHKDNELYDFYAIEKELKTLPKVDLPENFHVKMMAELQERKEEERSKIKLILSIFQLNKINISIAGVFVAAVIIILIAPHSDTIDMVQNEARLRSIARSTNDAQKQSKLVKGETNGSKESTNTEEEILMQELPDTFKLEVTEPDALNVKEASEAEFNSIGINNSDANTAVNNKNMADKTNELRKFDKNIKESKNEEMTTFDIAHDTEPAQTKKEITWGGIYSSYDNSGIKTVKTLTVKLQVSDIDIAMNDIRNISKSNLGYVEKANAPGSEPNILQSTKLQTGNISLIVPKKEYEDVKKQVSKIGNVSSMTEGVENFTELYANTENTIKVLESEKVNITNNIAQKGRNVQDSTKLVDIQNQIQMNNSKIAEFDKMQDFVRMYIDIQQVKK